MGRYYNNYVMDTLLPGARKEATLSLNLALIVRRQTILD